MRAVMLPFRECTPSKASTLSDEQGSHTSHDCGRAYAHGFTFHEEERAVREEHRRYLERQAEKAKHTRKEAT